VGPRPGLDALAPAAPRHEPRPARARLGPVRRRGVARPDHGRAGDRPVAREAGAGDRAVGAAGGPRAAGALPEAGPPAAGGGPAAWAAGLRGGGGWPGGEEWRHVCWGRGEGFRVPRPVAAGQLVGPWFRLQGFIAVEEL